MMLICCLHIPYWAEKGSQAPFHNPGGASLRDRRGSDFSLGSTRSRSFLFSPHVEFNYVVKLLSLLSVIAGKLLWLWEEEGSSPEGFGK